MNPRIRASLISIASDLLLITGKGVLAFLSGSAALLADAYHSLSDLFVSFAVLLGACARGWLEKRAAVEIAREGPPTQASSDSPLVAETDETGDEASRKKETTERGIPAEGDDYSYCEHDQGTATKGYWIEAGIAYVISLVILYLPYEIITRVGQGRPAKMEYMWVAILGVIVFIAVAYFLSRFKILIGKKLDSPALVADGYHSRMDMFTSLAVLLSLVGQMIGIHLDGLVAVVIAVMIGIVGLELFITSIMAFIKKGNLKRLSLFTWLQLQAEVCLRWLARRITGRTINLAGTELWASFSPRRWITPKRVAFFLVLVLLAYGFSGLSTIRPDERGVRLRLGRIVESDIPPGLTYALPWPFERLHRVRQDQVRRVEMGFRTSIDMDGSFSPLLWEATHQVAGYKKREEESIALTGDENLLDASLVLHYRLKNPVTATFQVNNVGAVLRGLLESSMRRILATETTDRALVEDRKGVLSAIREDVQQTADRLNLGVEVLEVFCHDLHPPLTVVSSFRDVFSAREERTTMLNKAETYRNTSLPKARADSLQRKQSAHAEAAENHDKATGDAQRFALTSRAFRLHPNVTSLRMHLEMVEAGLAGKRKIIANPDVNRGGYRLWLFAPEGASLQNGNASRAAKGKKD